MCEEISHLILPLGILIQDCHTGWEVVSGKDNAGELGADKIVMGFVRNVEKPGL